MKKRLTSALLSGAVLSALLSSAVPAPSLAEEAELVDSGISYTEQVKTIANPAAGYTTTVWANCSPGKTNVYSPTGSLVLFFINIGGFSSGINGTTDEDGTYTPGTDYEFDDLFFDSWRKTFENCRKNGCMVALRFRYDDNGRDNPEPDGFDKVLGHINQIKESGILEEYSDILVLVESGFVGKWGEQHGGKYTSVAYKAQVLDALLDAVPGDCPVTVRTPDIFAEWAGIKRAQLDDEELFAAAEEGDRLLSKRVGLYNDGYMGSDSDLGTFANRQIETNWLSRVTTETYYGGEFSGNLSWAQKYDTYLPENAIPEMYKTHLSYINGNIYQLYKDYTFGEEYDIEGVDNSAYYGETVFQFVRDHLGYRFVLRKSELSPKVEQGGELKLHFNVENTGFANPVPHTNSYVILEQDGTFFRAPVDIDTHDWRSCTVSENELTMKLPDSIRTGKWNVYFKSDMNATDDIAEMSKRSIRFANDDVWNGVLGANYVGSFDVSEASVHGTDNSFYVVGSDTPDNSPAYTLYNHTVIDGEDSFPMEWQEKDKIIENGDQSISVKADEHYLYVRANMPDGAKAPVYNLQIVNPENNVRYWIYFASNGYVYFNKGSYDGSICKYNGNIVELRIPFEVMELTPGMVLTSLRVSLQDSGNDWVVLGDLTAKEVTVPSDFEVFSAEYDIRLSEGDSKTVSVLTSIEDVEYQWYHDGELLEGETSESLTIENAEKLHEGNYSVKLTTADGIEKTVSVVNILEVTGSEKHIKGDANCDNIVDLADAVLIMQSISNPNKYGINGSDPIHITKQGAQNGDVIGNDGITNMDALEIQRFLLKIIDSFE